MNLCNNYLLVKQAKKQETGGFEFAEAVNELIGKGEVVKDSRWFKSLKGKTVYFEKSLGTEFEIKGEKVKFVRLEDVMGYE